MNIKNLEETSQGCDANEKKAKQQIKTPTYNSNYLSRPKEISIINVNSPITEPKNKDELKPKDSSFLEGSKKNDINKKEPKEDPQIVALKQTNMDFINTVSKGVSGLDNSGTDSNSINLNILIGNTDSHIVNQNLRNNGSFNKK